MATTGKQKGRAPSQECATLDTTEKQVHHTAPELPAVAAVTKDASRALVLEYEGQPVQFTAGGWIDGTNVARRFGKRLDNWLRSPSTKEYMGALADLYSLKSSELVQARAGRSGGTMLHPKLGVALARWCDARFAAWCDKQIDHILHGGLSLWRKIASDPSNRSQTADREPLLIAVAAIVARHGLPFNVVYEAANLFVGVAHART